MKTQQRPSTEPESRVDGNAQGGATSSDVLENLRKKAEKTNDYTEVYAYKRKMKADK